MLMQSSLPSSVEAGLSSFSDHGQQEFSCVWTPGDATWQECAKCDEQSEGGQREVVLVTELKNKDDSSCYRNVLSCSPQSTVTTMSEGSVPTLVYKRRKMQRNPATFFPAQALTNKRPSDICLSASSYEALSLAAKEHVFSLVDVNNGTLVAPDVPAVSRRELDSKSGSVDGRSVAHGPAIENDPKRDMQRDLDLYFIKDSCSSSKSNEDLGSDSLKPDVDDAGECSSSGAFILEGLPEDLSAKDQCISILRSHGVLEGVRPIKTRASIEDMDIRNDRSRLQLCSVCHKSEMTLKMLICDQCEESFHLSCCNPYIKKIPVDEWFCHSCLRKKFKKLKETSSSLSPKIVSGSSSRQKNVISNDELGPIASMLRDAEPFTTNVRIGKDFQAEVPDWSGPTTDDIDFIGEPEEMNSSEYASCHDWNSSKPSRLTSIGNWLQCQEIIDGVGEGVDGTICGKWRRAPLFEVQTDNWECFRSVLWDPTHADCAVPQELDTDQVLKQLKYIEMLRPPLAAKRCRMGLTREVDSQEPTEGLRNTRTL